PSSRPPLLRRTPPCVLGVVLALLRAENAPDGERDERRTALRARLLRPRASHAIAELEPCGRDQRSRLQRIATAASENDLDVTPSQPSGECLLEQCPRALGPRNTGQLLT